MNFDLDYNDIEESSSELSTIFVDLRSESEFKESAIPGALSIPIFNDDERVEIGTIYDRGDHDEAKSVGVKYASAKLPEIFDSINGLAKKYDRVVLYCSRGGYRSMVIFNFMRSLKVKVFRLNGGYKSYRAYINEALPKALEGKEAVVLYGLTGVGKTDILHELRRRGKPVLDLEAYANHKGSLLGSVGVLGGPNSQKMFESLLYEDLKKIDGERFFIEGESRRIGRIVIPDKLYEIMRSGFKVNVEASMGARIENIMRSYVKGNDDGIIEALSELKGFMNPSRVEEYIRNISEKRYETVIEQLFIRYYDPKYSYKTYKYDVYVNADDLYAACDKLEEFVKEKNSVIRKTRGKI